MKKHQRLVLCLIVNVCITPVLAQNSTADTAFISIPSNYISVVDKKISGGGDRLTQQSEKYLKSLARQEEKIFKKLEKLDSTATASAFGDAKEKYTQLSQKINDANGRMDKLLNGKYLPGVDSLATSLGFLKNAGNIVSRSKDIQQKLGSSLQGLQQLQSKLNEAKNIQQFVQQRCHKIISNKDKTKLNSTLQKMRADSFVIDIPRVSGGDDYISYYNRAIEAAQDLKLGQLTRGVDSVEIRIWFNYYGNSQQCLRFFNENEEWLGELITAHYTPPKDKQSKWEVSSSVEKKQPKNGWENFLKRSIELGILTLPDCNDLSDYGFATDGTSLAVFEIATKQLYRLYGYVDPISFKSTIKEAEKVEQLFELMQEEFDFKMMDEI